MSARDELTEVVWQASAKPDARTGRLLFLGASDTARIVEHLLAAGYSKPRTITTVEELDALPCGSVFRSENERLWEVEHIGYGGVEKALSAMGIGSMISFLSFREFPATVLYTPKES